jgi:hypothetical protein
MKIGGERMLRESPSKCVRVCVCVVILYAVL